MAAVSATPPAGPALLEPFRLRCEGDAMSYGGGPAGPGGGGILGDLFGRRQDYGPRGQFGIWPGCGCSSLFIILAGILLVCGGGLRMLNL